MLRYSTIGISALRNRRWLIAAGGVVFGMVLWRVCGHASPPIAAAVRHHEVESRVPEREIQRQRGIAAAAAKAERAVMPSRRHPERSEGPAVHQEQQVLRRFAPQDDAGDATLPAIVAAEDSALSLTHVQITALGTALDLSELRASRSDSLLQVVAARGGCRLVRVIPCPSRFASAILGAAAVVVLLKGVRFAEF